MTHEFIDHQSHTIQKAVGRERSGIVVALDDLGHIFKQSDALIKEYRIDASSHDGPFGGIFGRDSVITADEKVASYELCPNGQLDQVIHTAHYCSASIRCNKRFSERWYTKRRLNSRISNS